MSRSIGHWLGLAAAPTFAAMALAAAIRGGPLDALCGTGFGLGGMARCIC
jgi:hypothetical protein